MRHLLLPFAALAAVTFIPASQAAADESSGPAMQRMQRWAADHDAMLDARLAGLKAGLKLTPDQDKLWPPFETAVREAAKLHMEQMKGMMERMHKMREMMRDGNESEDMNEMAAVSPLDRLEAMGQRLSERGAAITKVADAAKPLYASLDDSQKRLFGLLGREMFMMGRHHPAMRGMGMMHGMMGGMGMMGHHGMGMMAPNSDRMEPAGNDSDDDEDSSDKE